MTDRQPPAVLTAGAKWSHTRKVGPGDVQASVKLGRDYGGYHVDEQFARAAGFRGLITSGCYHVAVITELAGQIDLLGRDLQVHIGAPIYDGDTLESTAEVAELHPESRKIKVRFRTVNQDAAEVLTAEISGYLPNPAWGVPRRGIPGRD